MIKTHHLKKNYGDLEAVKGIDLNIDEGTFYGLLGPNGAGKTTTIKMLSNLLLPTEGSIEILGEEISRGNKAVQARIGIVPQHYSLEKELSVEETLFQHGLLYKMKLKQIKERMNKLIEFAKMDSQRHKNTSKLSGGNKRKLMIIRAMMHEPKILFLDEPTVGLDASIRRSIWDLLKTLKSDGLTIIITSHYIEEARTLCDHIGIMTKGLIVSENTPEGFLNEFPPYTVECFDGKKTSYDHFDTRDLAADYMKGQSGDMMLRRTNLEDVYVKYTEEKE